MDEKQGEGSISDTKAKAEDTVKDLAEQAGTSFQQMRDRGQAVIHNLQASAGEAVEQSATLTRKVSAAGAQAAGAVQDAARQAGNRNGEGAALYQQGARAGGYVADTRQNSRSADRRYRGIRPCLLDPPALNTARWPSPTWRAGVT